jgi:hypothetical protein
LEPDSDLVAADRRPQTTRVSSPSLRAESTHGRAIGWCRHAEGARGERDDGDGVARHVEELDRVAFFGDIRHDVPLHDRADVAGAQTVFADVTGPDHVAVQVKGHVVYLGYMAMNRGTSVPVSTCQIEQNHTVLPLAS